MKTTKPTPEAVRTALIAMVTRYGSAVQAYGICAPGGTVEGKSCDYWWRARQRRFMAVQRLASALRDAEAVREPRRYLDSEDRTWVENAAGTMVSITHPETGAAADSWWILPDAVAEFGPFTVDTRPAGVR